MNYKPMEGFVIVESIVEKKTSLIATPDQTVDEGDGKTVKGKIVAVNSGRTTIDGSKTPSELKVGETILYSRYSPIILEGKKGKVYAVREDSIIAVILI